LTPEGLRSGLAELFDPAVGGKIKVTIGATYPMEKAAGAHRALEKQRASSRSTAIPTKRNS
jgi:hypothetical protein